MVQILRKTLRTPFLVKLNTVGLDHCSFFEGNSGVRL